MTRHPMPSLPLPRPPVRALWPAAAALLLGSVAGADVIIVDTDGAPVPGFSLDLIQRPPATFGPGGEPERRQSDAEGRVDLGDLTLAPLDFASAEPDWSIRFVHGHRILDEAAGEDLLGRISQVFDTSKDIVCVVEPTGQLTLRVEGGSATDRYHVVFVDERPEPESHRPVRSSGSFEGPSGTLRVRAGRGTVYVAEEGSLGAPVLGPAGPLILSVPPGGAATLAVRFVGAPDARLQAPFDAIPFAKIDALAPDGTTVVASFDFDASPLLVPCRVPLVATKDPTPELPGTRLPKHLLRATDVPLVLPAFESEVEPGEVLRTVERPPMELVFTVDPGAKVRLPEVQGGWIRRAKEGIALLSGPMGGLVAHSGIQRPAPGRITYPGAEGGEGWSARVVTKTRAGEPLPFTEVFVAVPGQLLARAITDASGVLSVEGLSSDEVLVAPVDSMDGVATLRPSARDEVPQTALSPAPRVSLTGAWDRAGTEPTAGTLLVLVPEPEAAMEARQRFMTHAAPMATLDANGLFDFGPVPRGLYTLRTTGGEATPLDLTGQGQPETILILSGTGTAFKATPKGR